MRMTERLNMLGKALRRSRGGKIVELLGRHAGSDFPRHGEGRAMLSSGHQMLLRFRGGWHGSVVYTCYSPFGIGFFVMVAIRS
jgi:hypothetical protein